MRHLRRNSWDLYFLCYYSTEGICFQVPFPAFCRRKAFFVPLCTVSVHIATMNLDNPNNLQIPSCCCPAAAATMTHHMAVSHGAVAHDAINDRAQMPDSFRQGDDPQSSDNDTPVQPQRKQWGLPGHTTPEKLRFSLNLWISTLLIVWRL